MLTIERGSGADAANIEVDGVSLGATSLGRPFPADPGPHAISAKAPGFKELVTVMQLAEGQHETFVVKLEPREPPATSRPPSETSAPPPEVTPAQKPSRLVPYVVGGVGAAALVGAGVLFVLRQNTLSKLEDECTNGSCPKSAKSDGDNLTTYHYGAEIALGVGIIGVGAAVTMILLEPTTKSSTQTGLRIVPTFSNASAGLRLQSRF
jgi:hypothetical protein